MEWSRDSNSGYLSTVPAIGYLRETIYVRAKEIKVSDSLYGADYKIAYASEPVRLDFDAHDSSKVTVFFMNDYVTPHEQHASVTIDPGISLGALMPRDPSRSGYSFKGWQTNTGLTFDATTVVTTTIYVYSQWELGGVIINPGTNLIVTYYRNDGTTAIHDRDTTIPNSGGYVKSLPSNPVRTGYIFTGWNMRADGTGTAFSTTTYVSQNLPVYAQWYNSAGGDGTTVLPNGQVPLGQRPPGFIEDHIPFLTGYPDGSVKPDNPITRAEVATIFFRLLSNPAKNNPRETVFSDVADRWFTQAVNYLASIEILTGYPEGDFRPDRPITRAEFAAVSSRFDKLAVMEGSAAFPDIEGHWAKEYINSAYAKGWVSGYPEGVFKPQQNITRAEVVKVVNTMLHRRLRIADMPADILLNIVKFTDAETHWAYDEIVEASNNHDYTRRSDGYETWTRLK
jgi:uncharacterized repeat protein (TIGR02543 family)